MQVLQEIMNNISQKPFNSTIHSFARRHLSLVNSTKVERPQNFVGNRRGSKVSKKQRSQLDVYKEKIVANGLQVSNEIVLPGLTKSKHEISKIGFKSVKVRSPVFRTLAGATAASNN